MQPQWFTTAAKLRLGATLQATVTGLAGHIAVERHFQRLSVTLQIFNASMILNRSPITLKVNGESSTESKV
jgi:hypothetical protein